MSNINYDIWGTPDTWEEWSDSPTNNVIWGNIRVGANNYSNADFTDYPQFKLGGTNQSLRTKVNAGDISLNTPLDNTIAYAAIANPDLPQMNVGLFGKGHTSKETPFAIRDNSNPIPFAFGYLNDLNDTYFNLSIYQQIYGFDGFPDNATVIGQQSLQRWAPYATMNVSSITTQFEYNQQGQIMPVISFGIKSVIYEIIIRYVDYNDETLIANLKSYLNHTADWLQNHKCVGAYLRPYYRVNVNGTYSNTIPTGVNHKYRANGIQPIFFTPYKLDGLDIYNYSSQWARVAGCLPIYGNCIVETSYIYRGINAYQYDNPDNDTCSYWALMYGYNRGNLHVDVSDNSSNTYITLDLSVAENVEYIMRGAAAYGLFFCQAIGDLGDSGRDTGVTERWIDNEMYCGLIESDGMTYGNYTQGAGNKDNPVYGWTDSTQTPFDPSNMPDTDNTHYNEKTTFNHYGLTAGSGNQYVVYEQDIVKLADIIATAINTRPDPDQLSTVDYTLNNALTNNPVDTIISVRAYPAKALPIAQKLVDGVLTDHEPLHCGAWYNNDVTGYFLGSTYDIISFSFRRGTNNGFVAAFGNSFLDYAPYTRAALIIPYCGTVQLNPADFLEHDINVKIIVDYITGLCTAFVMRENVAVMTVSGSMGIEVPITGLQNATYDAQRLNAVLNRENANASSTGAAVGLFGSSVGLVASLATGNAVGAIASIAGLGASIARQPSTQNAVQKADYELTHQQVPTKVVQSGSPMISYVYENCCRLIVYRPVISDDYDPAVYADTVGFACLINGTVSQFTGLTVGTIDTAGINCTEKEKEMIQKLFANGVYL